MIFTVEKLSVSVFVNKMEISKNMLFHFPLYFESVQNELGKCSLVRVMKNLLICRMSTD